jgi:hypothetical protein
MQLPAAVSTAKQPSSVHHPLAVGSKGVALRPIQIVSSLPNALSDCRFVAPQATMASRNRSLPPPAGSWARNATHQFAARIKGELGAHRRRNFATAAALPRRRSWNSASVAGNPNHPGDVGLVPSYGQM